MHLLDAVYQLRRPVLLSLSVLVVAGALYTTASGTWCQPSAPCEPALEAPASLPVLEVVQGNLPPPMRDQLRAGQCDPDRAEEEIEGGCWVRTKTVPDSSGRCPAGKQWEYQGACYVPAFDRKRPAVSGQ